jgi:nicotinamidase-related amidase
MARIVGFQAWQAKNYTVSFIFFLMKSFLRGNAGPAMADNLSINRRTSALLVMDFQTLTVDNYAAGAEVLLDRTAKLIAAARTAGMRVIYVVVGFRPGYPEVSDRNATFNGLKASGAFAAGAENAKIHPAVAPLAEEIVVTKHRVSAFAGTDLDLMLRANGVETLILTGIITSGVVLSTLSHAADADYTLLVVGDCCSDGDEEAHRVLLEKVFPRQATITTAAELAQAIGAGR